MRPPLTNKRKQAIHQYIYEKGKKGYFIPSVIDDTLKAERMKAEALYEWLEKRGYRWNSRYWSKVR